VAEDCLRCCCIRGRCVCTRHMAVEKNVEIRDRSHIRMLVIGVLGELLVSCLSILRI